MFSHRLRVNHTAAGRALRIGVLGAMVLTGGDAVLRAQAGSPLLVLQTAPNGPVMNSIGFGNAAIGNTINKTVTLSNAGGGTLTFTSLSISGVNAGDFALGPNTCMTSALAAGQICTISVSFTPTTGGRRDARLNLGNNALGSPQLLPLTGFGIPAGPQKAVGPVDLRIGYPAYYTDQSGLSLAPCIDDASMCLTPVPDLTRPPSVTGDPSTTNFNDEFFYYDVEATFPNLPNKSQVRMVLEGAFNTAELTPGEQIAFGRIRIRISGLKPNVTYRISHPYGHDDLLAEPDVTGGRINSTVDIGSFSSPSDFAETLNARIWPFLTWAPLSAAPAGFIGDPNILHAITPGPGGDFIRIEELNAAGAVVALIDQTNLFTVSGRIANGAVAPQTPNQAPVAGDDVATTTAPNAVVIRVLANDIDPDGDPIQITSVGAAAHGTTSLNNNGAFITYTPDAGFSGTDSFSYTIDDFRGGSATANVTVTVNPGNNPVNNAPVANADTATGQTGTPIIVGVLLNDTDPDGDPLTVVSATAGSHGTTTVNSGLTVTYTSAPGFVGTDTFVYTIDDAHGHTTNGLVTVEVTAAPPVNHLPIANPDAAATLAGVPVVIDVVGGTTPGAVADTDPDGDELTLVSVTQGTGGLASLQADGTIRFTPATGFVGVASFTYTITDGLSGNVSALVSVTVVQPNRAPVAISDSATTTAGVAVTIPVLANDSDPDGDPLTISSVSNLVGGTAAISGSSVIFTPAAGFSGAASFTYAIGDGRGATASANVSVTVNAAPAGSPTRVALVSVDGTGALLSPAFSTTGPTVLVALAASDGPTPSEGANTQSLTISGGGLTWTRVARVVASRGDSEIWTATAPAALTNVRITSTQLVTTAGGAAVNQSLMVAAFSNASGVGAFAVNNRASGTNVTPTATLITQGAGSLVYGVGNDFDRAINHPAGAGQTQLHQFLAPSGDTMWMQMLTNPAGPAGSSITLNTTAPTQDQWNFAIVEIKR